jgi:hypothetical protein
MQSLGKNNPGRLDVAPCPESVGHSCLAVEMVFSEAWNRKRGLARCNGADGELRGFERERSLSSAIRRACRSLRANQKLKKSRRDLLPP